MGEDLVTRLLEEFRGDGDRRGPIVVVLLLLHQKTFSFSVNGSGWLL